jgi:hypothetical protein
MHRQAAGTSPIRPLPAQVAVLGRWVGNAPSRASVRNSKYRPKVIDNLGSRSSEAHGGPGNSVDIRT